MTGRTQPGPEGGSSRGRLGDLGGCDHPSLWQASEGSGITGRLWLQKAGSERQPVRKLASRIFQRHEAEARCLVQEENRTLRSNSSSVASTSPRSPWPEHGVRGEKKRPSLQNGAHTPCPACLAAIDVESWQSDVDGPRELASTAQVRKVTSSTAQRKVTVVTTAAAAVPVPVLTVTITAADMETSSKEKVTSQRAEPGLQSNSPNFEARKSSFFPTRLLDGTNSKAAPGPRGLGVTDLLTAEQASFSGQSARPPPGAAITPTRAHRQGESKHRALKDAPAFQPAALCSDRHSSAAMAVGSEGMSFIVQCLCARRPCSLTSHLSSLPHITGGEAD